MIPLGVLASRRQPASGGDVREIVHVGQMPTVTSNVIHTYSNVNLGSSGSVVILAVASHQGASSGYKSVSSVTANGVALNLDYAPVSDGYGRCVVASGPFSGVADIEVNFVGSAPQATARMIAVSAPFNPVVNANKQIGRSGSASVSVPASPSGFGVILRSGVALLDNAWVSGADPFGEHLNVGINTSTNDPWYVTAQQSPVLDNFTIVAATF